MNMRTFRPGATILPLLIWTLLVGVTAFFVERHALGLPRGSGERWIAQLIFAACMVLGPAVFVAHLVRRARISVAVDPACGLVLSGRKTIPWEAIDRVERRAGPFRGGNIFARFGRKGGEDRTGAAMIGADAAFEGCFWGAIAPEGCAIGLALVAVFGLIWVVFLPVLSLLSPWHARVILHLKGGERIIYRDLEQDEEFAERVRQELAASRSPQT